MHTENKLTNHGKQVTSGAQIPNVNPQQQGPAGNLGSKGGGPGNHGVKTNQISPGNAGLKSVGQSGGSVGVGGMLKTKAKRERSIPMDTGDQRDTLTPVLEPDAKEGVMRSKRRCVLEKKQPYSGDEWCSGAESEEDEDKPPSSTHRERVMPCPGQSLSGLSVVGSVNDQGGPALGCGLGPGLRADLTSHPSQQVVYVFTTSLANSAAEAVVHGHVDSILLFHQQNVPRAKLDQCTGAGKLPSLSEHLNSGSTPPISTPKSQSATPRPASVGGVVGGHLAGGGTPSSTGHPEGEPPQAHASSTSSHSNSGAAHSGGPGPQPVGGSGSVAVDGPGTINHPGAGVSPTASPSMLSAHLQGEHGQQGAQGPADGLSKEQLEHRERSLQTLRDIERLLLRSGAGGAHGEAGGPNNGSNINNNNGDGARGLEDGEDGSGNAGNSSGLQPGMAPGMPPMGGLKKYEEPLQSIISQTQNLGGPGMDDALMGPHHILPPHHHLPSPSGMDMGPVMAQEGLTPEQIAWRKLQEEYYQEKRRQQEMNPHAHPQHFRMMPEMGMAGGPHIMMRGPPPPYHSKPGDQQWGPGPMMGGAMGGNMRMMDMHQEGPRGPRFLGQMQRVPPGGGGYPGSPGGVLPMEGLGTQRPPRPGMGWLDDMPPNMGGGGSFHGCYPAVGPGGPPQHMQGDLDRPLTREEMFRIMEKRQLQGFRRLELEQLSRQQAGLGGPRMMDNPGGPGFSNPGMGGGPPTRGDPIDFPGSRAMMGSPIGGAGGPGSLMRDMVDSPLGGNLNMNVGMNLTLQQQQMLAQKLRGGPGVDMLNPEDISRIRAAQNGRVGVHKGMVSGPDGILQFPNQGPYPGGQGDGPFLQQSGPEMFGPDQPGPPQISGTSRLSHLPMDAGPRGADLGARHPSDLSINVNPMSSPAMPPPHQLKSPSLSQEPSPLMPSPSAPGLKSPTQLQSSGPPHPPLPAASGAGTPSTTSMKSPQVMGSSLGLRSPSGSPGHLKSPAMPVASPGWTASPKTALPSPGGPPSSKGAGNGGSSSTETGMSLPPRSSTSTPSSQPPSMPFTSSPDAPPSQNPLSLIMSQMSKYAMPTSTPLYHDAIKTIATSDDEMAPDRPLLPGSNMPGNMGNHQTAHMLLASQGSMGPPSSPQSPMGMVLQGGQQLSHDPSGPLLPSPNPMGMPAMMGGGGGPPDGIGPCSVSPMHPPNQMGGFSRMQGPMHSPMGSMGQQYPPPPDDVPLPQQMHLLAKGMHHQRLPNPPDGFPSMPMGEGPDLSEVIRPTHTGIPEFDLSRIIPSDKPSSTLQYFPKSEAMSQAPQTGHPGPPPQQSPSTQLLKQLSSSGPPHSATPSSNPHIANLQNMMAEQQIPLHPSHCGLRPGVVMTQAVSRGMGAAGGMGPGPICHTGHMLGRTGMPQQQQLHPHQQQQAMMQSSILPHQGHPPPGMMSPQQHPHNMMTQQNLMMMQAKQRGMGIPAEHFGQQGPLMSPQGPMMVPPHPQSVMMGPQGMRQRGMSLDSPLGYGPGSMPF
ncbi:B-cell CLL/lymphoma 9-like protein isoform X2 [Brachyhypopomus gauderio]|uniref:B-cell CLL/lymphoma 9-like protein isoform X2 n=1 Tax=Brachyhypopomus gauderio TaxID=698409 RepID=UPI004042D878